MQVPFYNLAMLAKLTSKNQITLPKKALKALGAVTYFEVEVEEDHLVLRPARVGAASEVRRKLAELGLTNKDMAAAITWVRKRR